MPTPLSSTTTPARTLPKRRFARAGEVNWTVLLWAIGVPLPLVLIIALVRGCH